MSDLNDQELDAYPCLRKPEYRIWRTLYSRLFDIITGLIALFEKRHGVRIHSDWYIITEIRHRLFTDIQHLDYFHKCQPANGVKFSGHLCYWIKELKPFSTDPNPIPLFNRKYLNELLAYYIGLWLLGKGYEIAEINEDMLKELVYGLRYRPISAHSICLIFAAITRMKRQHRHHPEGQVSGKQDS